MLFGKTQLYYYPMCNSFLVTLKNYKTTLIDHISTLSRHRKVVSNLQQIQPKLLFYSIKQNEKGLA